MRYLLFLGIISWVACRTGYPPKSLLIGSSTLITVITEDWKATQGKLSVYQRTKKGSWLPKIKDIPVTVGRNGLAYGEGSRWYRGNGKDDKKEGDGKAPAGLFPLTAFFGYQKDTFAMPYYHAADSSLICVDDVNSRFYNQLIHQKEVETPDYKSFEYMRRGDKQYELGVIIGYNTAPIIKGKGSCVFMHIWKAANNPTSGCTAMNSDDLKLILQELDIKDKPLLLQLPKEEWQLCPIRQEIP